MSEVSIVPSAGPPPPPRHQTLYFADCLETTRKWGEDVFDLVYLDPPFNSDVDYNMLFGRQGSESIQYQVFTDIWEWDDSAIQRCQDIQGSPNHPLHKPITGFKTMIGESGMLSYLSYLGVRLVEFHRVLKLTGSLMLHCDPTASHYLKLMLDAIFGADNFANEVIWAYRGPGAKKRFARKHDVILFYQKNHRKAKFNAQYTEMSEETKRAYRHQDEDGRFYYRRMVNGEEKRTYLDENPGKPVLDWWDDIPSFQSASHSNERLGYPTQKPLKLMKRIIAATTDRDDLVLDPFCGCGTTIEAAHLLERQWVGIDISPIAIDIVREKRLEPHGIHPKVEGVPQNQDGAETLAKANPKRYLEWAVSHLRGFAPVESSTDEQSLLAKTKLIHFPSGEKGVVLALIKHDKFTIEEVKAFIAIRRAQDATAGLLINLHEEKRSELRLLASEQGFFKPQGSKQRYPRMAFFSIEEHLAGRQLDLPPRQDPVTGSTMGEVPLTEG